MIPQLNILSNISSQHTSSILKLISRYSFTRETRIPRTFVTVSLHITRLLISPLIRSVLSESLRFVQKRIEDELSDLSPLLVSVASPLPTSPTAQVEIEAINLPISYYLTSVLDHTLHDTFARVFTRILAPGCLPYLEQLLNAFSDTSNSTKAFLFDMKAKFYVATDNAPVDTVTHNLCCDYVHMLNEFSGLYK